MKTRRRKKALVAVAAILLFSSVSAWAILPALAVFAPQLIGATIATVVVGGVATKIAQSPTGTFVADTSTLKVPVVAYNTAVQAGAEIALGYASSIPWDFKTAWNDGSLSSFPPIQTVARATYPGVIPEGDLTGYDIACLATNPQCTAGKVARVGTAGAVLYNAGSYGSTIAVAQGFLNTATSWGTNGRYINPGSPFMLTTNFNVHLLNGQAKWDQRSYAITYVTGVPSPPPAGVPDIMGDEQASQLAANLAAAQSDAFLKDALKAAVASRPDLLSPPAVTAAAIPQAKVNDYLAGGSAAAAIAAAQAAADAAAAAVAANPTKTALEALVSNAVQARVAAEAALLATPGDVAAVKALDVAKQQEQDARNLLAADPTVAILKAAADKAAADLAAIRAAEQVKTDELANEVPPETFAPVTAGAFAAPYNPGAFDIPARFTAFFATVKASPIFSFSTSFFSSLPTGGNSTFTIDAGTYGNHTVDVAETMAPGMVFLSKLLLVVFGFISIRTIILKR